MIAIRQRALARRQPHGGVFRTPLLVIGLVALAAFGADLALVLTTPVPAWDVSTERAVQAVPWGPMTMAFSASDWLEGLRQARIAGWILAVAWLALVAVGRIDLAEHWPSDVLAGLFLGVAWTALGLAYRPISRGALDG